MGKMLQLEHKSSVFLPNDADKAFERKVVCAPCLTERNKKFTMFQNRFKDQESLDLVHAGYVPKNPVDRKYFPNTWELYRDGARKMMSILGKKYKREVHYSDFYAFGEPDRFLRPYNAINDINREISNGNHKTNTLEGYKLILQAQLKESETNEMKFASEVVNSENMTEAQLNAQCRDRARLFRFDTTSVITQMSGEKPHAQFTREKKDMTENRRLNREQEQGQQVPDAQVVLQKYFNDEDVKASEKALLEMATDQNKVPSRDDMREFTNNLLVRLTAKNGKRREIFTKMTREEFLESKVKGIKVHQFSHVDPQETDRSNVFNLGGELGHVRIESTEIDPDQTRPSELEGVMLERRVHKTGHAGAAIVFLSLPDMVLCDSYHAVAQRYTKAHNIPYKERLDSTFFINSLGGQVSNIDYRVFRHATGYTEFKSHDARRLFSTWMTSQQSMQLAEFAAFASSHSVAVQRATYLGAQSKRLQAIVADTYYHCNTGSYDPSAQLQQGQNFLVNEEYAAGVREDLQELDRNRWQNSLQNQRRDDLRIVPRPDRVITPDVVVNLLSLIVTLGVEGSFEKESNINVMDFFLKDTAGILNHRGRALILTMMDFAPQLASTKILHENLNIFCTMQDRNTHVNKLEKDWAEKMVEALRRFNNANKQTLSVRVKDILAPLNKDYNYRYCLGNSGIVDTLKSLNSFRFAREQSIKQLTSNGAAVSVIDAINTLKRRQETQRERQHQQLQQEALSRQERLQRRPHDDENDEDQRSAESVDMSNKDMPEILEEMPNCDLPNDVPPAVEETIQYVRADPSMRLTIRNEDTELNIPVEKDTMISLTPAKTSRGIEVTKTPAKDPSEVDSLGRTKRLPNLSNLDKIELLGEFISHAESPCIDWFERRGNMRVDCEHVFQVGSITRGQIKGVVYNHFDNLVDLLLGRNNQGLNMGEFKKKGMLVYVTEVMNLKYPGLTRENWKIEQVRELRDEILLKAKSDCGL